MEQKEERKTVRFLRVYFCTLFSMVLMGACVLLGFKGMVQEAGGDSQELALMDYVAELVTVGLTLFCVLWSVKVVRLKKVRKLITRGCTDYLERYKVFCLLRFGVPFGVILAGAAFYVLLGRQTFLYCGLIGLLAVLYGWPSLERLERETAEEEREERETNARTE